MTWSRSLFDIIYRPFIELMLADKAWVKVEA